MADQQMHEALEAIAEENIINLLDFIDEVGGIEEVRAAMDALNELKHAA